VAAAEIPEHVRDDCRYGFPQPTSNQRETNDTFAFVIEQTGKNLGSATNQGTISVGGTQIGTWCAVRA
jgi:hypothetical protein